ncbi:T9SS type A sorting domain-containing protein [Paraflavitalea speifideaquila]|uniref:T9SS type A sorting domain-containing protein n=1 Tax=Paraflavitalea speifideaquila TaxID=3076558 RepID=UPI0028E63112|nr:T9SS type A sorting domain-containing protein [Paraflavitalea speifideiaquila]
MTNVWTNGDYTSCGFPVLAPALIANKTYRNINGRPEVVGGDTVEYVIEVMNTGNLNAAGVKLYDGIPASTNYIPGSTKLNGVTIPDVSGAMPYSIAGGRLINTLGQPNGIIRPGMAYKVVMTFRVKTNPSTYVCNQSKVTLFDMNGNTIFINTNDPTQVGGGLHPTCFYAYGVLAANTLSFKASLVDEKSILQWNVKDEHNINYYEVEYSTDGTHFTALGRVNSKGNNAGTNTYQFTDESNMVALSRYYRLKIVGAGGGYTYSTILKLSLKNLQVARIMPNPFDKVINIQLFLKRAEKVNMRLVDMYGRVVYQSAEALSKGTHALSIQVPDRLSAGTYVLELMAGADDLYQQKLLKR